MPVTKTAKRALRSSNKKRVVNSQIKSRLEISVRLAKKTKSKEKINQAVSYTDRAAKKKLIHKNKAARIKRALLKLQTKSSPKSTTKKSKSAK